MSRISTNVEVKESLVSAAERRGDPTMAIGAVAERTGLSVSAIRFYEDHGLVTSERTAAGHRRFARSSVRRLSFVRICQQLGYSLDEIRRQLDALPAGRTPTEADWQRLAEGFAVDIDARIAGLQELRRRLDGCIGCGCLSLRSCRLWNADDRASALGTGPRWLLGDVPERTSD